MMMEEKPIEAAHPEEEEVGGDNSIEAAIAQLKLNGDNDKAEALRYVARRYTAHQTKVHVMEQIQTLIERMNKVEEILCRDEINEEVKEELEDRFLRPLRARKEALAAMYRRAQQDEEVDDEEEHETMTRLVHEAFEQLHLNDDDDDEEEECNVDCEEETLAKFVRRDYNALRLRALEKLGVGDDTLNVTKETVETNYDDEDDEHNGSDNEEEDDGYGDPDEDDEEDEEYNSSDSEEEDDGYGDPDEDEYLPIIVLNEIIDRQEQLQNDKPPSDEVVQALRKHFQSERFDDYTLYCHGSFIECMTAIGAKPSAKDPLVYETKYNLDQEDEDDKREVLKHEAEVRLLRYGELIEDMAAKGIKAGEDWVLQGTYYDDDYEGGTDSCKESLNMQQIMAFGQALSYGWYYYTNFDNLYVGRGVGVSEISSAEHVSRGSKNLEMDVDETILMNQCTDIERRYEEMKCPLGPEAVFKAEREGEDGGQTLNNRKGKKNRGKGKQKKRSGWGSKPHFEEITMYLTNLLQAMDKHLLPTDVMGLFVSRVAEMLESAAQYDPAVANSLLDKGESSCGSIALKLYVRATKIAEVSLAKGEAVKEKIWRLASSALMGALCYSVRTLFAKHFGKVEGIDDASTFFFKRILPELVTGVESCVSQERSDALDNLRVALSLAPPTVLMRFMEKKGSWARIETACRTSLDDCIKTGELKTDNAKESSWLSHMKHSALKAAAMFLECLCARSFNLQNAGQSGDVVAPTSLTEKMVKRGVIPLLMDIAKADVGRPSNKAMEALATISRVKDCRTIMLQDEGGLELIKRCLSTKDAEMFSSTVLLILHLLWDEEWAEPLSSIEPGVVSTSIRWGLFAMDCIIKRAEDRKKQRKAIIEKFRELDRKAWRLEGGDEKKRAQREAEEMRKKIPESELQLETGKNFTSLDRLLLRCCLILQVVSKLEGGSDQLVQYGGLSLLSSCIDIPFRDTQSAAVIALRNAFVFLGSDAIIPSNFNDPAHLVRALLSFAVHLSDDQNFMITMTETAGMLKAVPIWAPYFEQLPVLWKAMSQIIPPIYEGLSKRPADVKMVDPISSTNHTGKLRSCGGCGKLETKRGSMSKCSRCFEVIYCSRECQVSHWKRGHKQECTTAKK